jgi:hypothetical protein
MESWPHYIWIKRSLPLVIVALGWFGYTQYAAYSVEKADTAVHQNALVVARLWVAAAQFRHDQDAYRAYRDSLLAAEQLSKADLDGYLTSMDGSSDRSIEFSRLVDKFVDSLASLEESKLAPADSLGD